MELTMTAEHMTTDQAALYVGHGTSARTIVAWIHSGRLKAHRAPSARGRFFIAEKDLLEAMQWSPDLPETS